MVARSAEASLDLSSSSPRLRVAAPRSRYRQGTVTFNNNASGRDREACRVIDPGRVPHLLTGEMGANPGRSAPARGPDFESRHDDLGTGKEPRSSTHMQAVASAKLVASSIVVTSGDLQRRALFSASERLAPSAGGPTLLASGAGLERLDAPCDSDSADPEIFDQLVRWPEFYHTDRLSSVLTDFAAAIVSRKILRNS